MSYTMNRDKLERVAALAGLPLGIAEEYCLADWDEGEAHQTWLDTAPDEEIASWLWDVAGHEASRAVTTASYSRTIPDAVVERIVEHWDDPLDARSIMIHDGTDAMPRVEQELGREFAGAAWLTPTQRHRLAACAEGRTYGETPDGFVPPETAAQILAVSVRRVRQLGTNGTITTRTPAPGRNEYKLADVLRYAAGERRGGWPKGKPRG